MEPLKQPGIFSVLAITLAFVALGFIVLVAIGKREQEEQRQAAIEHWRRIAIRYRRQAEERPSLAKGFNSMADEADAMADAIAKGDR